MACAATCMVEDRPETLFREVRAFKLALAEIEASKFVGCEAGQRIAVLRAGLYGESRISKCGRKQQSDDKYFECSHNLLPTACADSNIGQVILKTGQVSEVRPRS